MEQKKKLFITFFLLVVTPLTILAVKKVYDWRKGAAGVLANIVIDSSSPQAPINSQLWQNFGQGGEEVKDMLAPVVDELRQLKPQLIRVDHIYDYYNVYQDNGQYDFARLDKVVKTILAAGAKPMLSLSYIPSSLSVDGQITSPPKDWGAWENLVKATVERYSGRSSLNIYNVYYEVYNEPDLFGGWHYGKSPNYLTLYYRSVRGAQRAANTNPFKIGGPATTGFYSNWIKALFKFASKNKLRVDFISWHRYSHNPQDYDQDFEKLNRILTDYPDYFSVERIITEFGPDSEPSEWYFNRVGATHALTISTHLLDKVHRVFAFEIKDGPPQPGKKDTEHWGIIGHESTGKKLKPRWQAYVFLNQLTGLRLPLSGNGTWVSGVAAKEGNKFKVFLVNYDPRGRHSEFVPLRINNLTPGSYEITLNYLFGRDLKVIQTIDNRQLFRQIPLSPNDAVFITLVEK